MNNIEIYRTADGSIGLYDKKLNEIYHSKFGAKTEAFEKFIKPALLLNDRNVDILDICYGIGYNTKCALENFNQINSIDCVEIDEDLAKKSFEFEYDNKINQIIKSNLCKPDFINFYFDDIRRVIKSLNKKYDVIFHDGFAPYKQPELWSEELISEIAKHLKSDGIYCTYNHSKPVLNALFKAGLCIGKTLQGGKISGTVASFDEKLIKSPFDKSEIELLNTKSAITYKDKNLSLNSESIIKNREEEVKTSKLETLSRAKKYMSKQENC